MPPWGRGLLFRPHFTPWSSIHWLKEKKNKERSLHCSSPPAASRTGPCSICPSERGGGMGAPREQGHKESQSPLQSVEWLKHSIVWNMNESLLWGSVWGDPSCPPISHMINQITREATKVNKASLLSLPPQGLANKGLQGWPLCSQLDGKKK